MKSLNRILFMAPSVQAGWQKQSHITDFKLIEKLGSGSFGTVYKVIHKKTNKVYAVKQIKKSTLDSQKLLEHARTEVKIMYTLNHPNIIKLHNHFEDQVSIFLVLEYASKGQLYSLLKSQPQKKFSEPVAAEYIRQITEAIKEIHCNKIMHRDLKLENILVDASDSMKIADFGWSHYVDYEKRTTYCGTLDYLAPEMVEKGHRHDEKVDIWSIGVLVYELTTGYSPFSCTLSANDISIQNVKANIKSVNYRLPSHLSQGSQDLIKRILRYNPSQRPTSQQILAHPWIRENSRQLISNQNWLQNIKDEMKSMFPELDSEKDEKAQFSKEQIYKYLRPDSIINLKPKKQNQKPGFLFNKSKVIEPGNESLNKNQSKMLSQLQVKVIQLERQRKNDRQQIERLKEQLFKAKDHRDCQNKMKVLRDQIIQKNQLLESMTMKLNNTEARLLQYQRR